MQFRQYPITCTTKAGSVDAPPYSRTLITSLLSVSLLSTCWGLLSILGKLIRGVPLAHLPEVLVERALSVLRL